METTKRSSQGTLLPLMSQQSSLYREADVVARNVYQHVCIGRGTIDLDIHVGILRLCNVPKFLWRLMDDRRVPGPSRQLKFQLATDLHLFLVNHVLVYLLSATTASHGVDIKRGHNDYAANSERLENRVCPSFPGTRATSLMRG